MAGFQTFSSFESSILPGTPNFEAVPTMWVCRLNRSARGIHMQSVTIPADVRAKAQNPQPVGRVKLPSRFNSDVPDVILMATGVTRSA
jgi:hypothetical protein